MTQPTCDVDFMAVGVLGERGPPWEEVEGDVGMEFISSSPTGGWVAPATAIQRGKFSVIEIVELLGSLQLIFLTLSRSLGKKSVYYAIMYLLLCRAHLNSSHPDPYPRIITRFLQNLVPVGMYVIVVCRAY